MKTFIFTFNEKKSRMVIMTVTLALMDWTFMGTAWFLHILFKRMKTSLRFSGD